MINDGAQAKMLPPADHQAAVKYTHQHCRIIIDRHAGFVTAFNARPRRRLIKSDFMDAECRQGHFILQRLRMQQMPTLARAFKSTIKHTY